MGLKLAPKPEDIIHDATATPADVIAGKVFYNNEGRKVGEMTDYSKFIKKVAFTIPSGTFFHAASYGNSVTYAPTFDCEEVSEKYYKSRKLATNTAYQATCKLDIDEFPPFDVSNLLYIKINDCIFDVNISLFDGSKYYVAFEGIDMQMLGFKGNPIGTFCLSSVHGELSACTLAAISSSRNGWGIEAIKDIDVEIVTLDKS